MSKIVALDIGYGQTKGVSEDDDRLIFPSIVSKKVGETALSDTIQSNKDNFEVCITKDGIGDEYYYVGDAGISMSSSSKRSFEENPIQNSNLKIITATALHRLTDDDTGKHDINLIKGLPLSYYSQQKERVKEDLEGEQFQITINNISKFIRIDNIEVLPQGAGVYYDQLLNLDGSIKDAELYKKPIGIIDIGYRTFDYLVMSKGKSGLILREDLTGSMEDGMNKVVKGVQKRFEKNYKKSIHLQKVEQALLWYNGKLFFKGEEIDLKPYELEAKDEFTEDVIGKIKTEWNDEIDHLGAIIIGGGGGKALYKNFKTRFHTTIPAYNGIYSNATGFMAAYNLSNKKKR